MIVIAGGILLAIFIIAILSTRTAMVIATSGLLFCIASIATAALLDHNGIKGDAVFYAAMIAGGGLTVIYWEHLLKRARTQRERRQAMASRFMRIADGLEAASRRNR